MCCWSIVSVWDGDSPFLAGSRLELTLDLFMGPMRARKCVYFGCSRARFSAEARITGTIPSVLNWRQFHISKCLCSNQSALEDLGAVRLVADSSPHFLRFFNNLIPAQNIFVRLQRRAVYPDHAFNSRTDEIRNSLEVRLSLQTITWFVVTVNQNTDMN
jgi:hypothetical protein